MEDHSMPTDPHVLGWPASVYTVTSTVPNRSMVSLSSFEVRHCYRQAHDAEGGDIINDYGFEYWQYSGLKEQ